MTHSNSSDTTLPSMTKVIATTLALAISLLALAQLNAQTATQDHANYTHHVKHLHLGEAQELVVDREFAGRVESQQTLQLGFELAGSINKLTVKEGDYVEKGQLIASLDSSLLEADLDKFSAQISQTQAKLTLNKQTLKRQQSLKDQHFSAEQRLNELQSEQSQLLASLDLIRAQQKQIQIRIKKSQLLAPFSGQIVQRFQLPGSVVSPSQAIVELVQDQQLEINIGVPISFAQQLTLGDSIQIKTLSEENETLHFAANIQGISRSVETGGYTQFLRLALPDSFDAAQLVNGQIVLATIKEVRHINGYWIPNTALTEGLRGTWNIMLLSKPENGKQQINKVAVTAVHFTQSHTFINKDDIALDSTSQYISEGTQRLSNKQWVNSL